MKTKRIVKYVLVFLLISAFSLVFYACGYSNNGREFYGIDSSNPSYLFEDGDEFTKYTENQFVKASETPVSYFSMDVSTASYSILRNYINTNTTLNKDMVKIEEMINYFNYSYPEPEEGEPFSMTGNIFQCPWNQENLLFSVGLKAKNVDFENISNNLVFLIDTSGSMSSSNKLPLLKEAFCLLVDNLNNNDIISIVTYAGSSRVALQGARGSEKTKIKNAINNLSASGSTNGAGGIQSAYELAEEYYLKNGNNRVILATDGDFNVGISGQDQLKTFISEKRQQSKGIYLSIMGFGLGNLKSTTMDTLAQNGNGAAYYIDTISEAKKVMVEGIRGTLVTVADDVKASVEFNPDKIDSYRLLGYETKSLTQEDWENNLADSGEIGAGHTVTAVYEIKLSERANENSANEAFLNNFIKSSIRYKEPYSGERPETDTREVNEIFKFFGKEDILDETLFKENEDLMFISAVIESALIFRDSAFKGEASLDAVIERLDSLESVIEDEYRAEFLALVTKYKQNH